MSEEVPPTQLPPGVAPASAAEGPPEWQPGDVILDLYEVTALLGEGGMGKVHKVRHRGWNLDLAVKSPRPEVFAGPGGREAFVREAETWVDLGLHPHLVTCHYVRSLGGVPRVFAEFVDGGSLSDWIRSGKLYEGGADKALSRILDVAIQFAWGLGYAHEKGFVHQDVKPANLMLTSAGDAKVTDFGLARARMAAGRPVAEASGHGLLVTTAGMTPAYCSPEQARGEALSRATDFWSWALSVLEMFTGEVTWGAGQAGADALRDVVESGTGSDAGPRLPPAMAELLGRCLRAAPSARPTRMEDVADRLRAVHRELTGSAHERSAPKPAALQADGLNNRALSYLDLGRVRDAERCWNSALFHDALHPEALYNSLVWRWRQAEIGDEEVLGALSVLGSGSALTPRATIVTALAHIERGDREAAVSLLEALGAAGGEEARAALRQANTGDLGLARPLRVLEGHRGHVTAACLSADGRTAVTGGADATVRTWDRESGRQLLTFVGHQSRVTSLALAADGRRAVSGGRDATVRLWDLSRKQRRWLPRLSRDLQDPWKHEVRTLQGHERAVTCVALTPDARWALSGSEDGSVRLWEMDTPRCVRTLIHEPVVAVWLSADGSRAASAGRATIRLWDLASGRSEGTVNLPRVEKRQLGSEDWPWVEFSPDGGSAFWADPGASPPQSYIWRLGATYWVQFPVGQWQFLRGRFSPSGRRLLLVNVDRLRLWDVGSGRCLLTLRAPTTGTGMRTTWFACLDFGADGRSAVSGCRRGRIHVWQLPSEGERVDSFQTSTPWSHGALWDVTTRARQLRDEARSALADERHSEAHALLVEARALPGQDRTVDNMTAWTALSRVCGRRRVKGLWKIVWIDAPKSLRDAYLARDGRWAAWCGGDATVRVWDTLGFDTLGGKHQHALQGHREEVRSISVSHDERRLLSGSRDSMRLWDRETGRCLRDFGPIVDRRTWCSVSVSLSPDGAWAASAGSGPVRIWDVATGRCVRVLAWSNPHQVAWTPDGRGLLAADHLHHGGRRLWIQVWDVASGRCVRTLENHISPFCTSANGRRVVAPRKHWVGGRFAMDLLDLADGARALSFPSHAEPGESLTDTLSLSADGGWLLFARRLIDLSDPTRFADLGQERRIGKAWLSADASWILGEEIGRANEPSFLALWQVDWELEPREAADWDEAVRPFLEAFLTLHTPYAGSLPPERDPTPDEVKLALTRRGKPVWSEADFECLLHALGCAGLGWLRPEGIRRHLEQMKAATIRS